MAALELHVPQWRFAADNSRGNPDRLVLDLDPGPGTTLAQCAEVARIAREILTGMGLDPVPVTSGDGYYGDDGYDNDERLSGYDVTYEYANRTYHTRTNYHPGDRIRVRVDVRPE